MTPDVQRKEMLCLSLCAECTGITFIQRHLVNKLHTKPVIYYRFSGYYYYGYTHQATMRIIIAVIAAEQFLHPDNDQETLMES